MLRLTRRDSLAPRRPPQAVAWPSTGSHPRRHRQGRQRRRGGPGDAPTNILSGRKALVKLRIRKV